MTALNPSRSEPTIVIAGGGPAGALTALHLARAARQRAVPLSIVVADPTSRLGAGSAFGTPDEAHLLNVPASGMSAFPQVPGHFVEWLRQTHGHEGEPYEFVARSHVARYLRESLERAVVAAGNGVHLVHEPAGVMGLKTCSDGLTVELDDGRPIAADALVVATGMPKPGTGWAPHELVAHPRFISDPWEVGALDRITGDPATAGDVLLVGCGLTMADVALALRRCRPRRVLHAISRSGRLPERHAAVCRPPIIPDVSGWAPDLKSLRAEVARHLREAEDAVGDWRPAVDGLRFHLSSLWARLSEDDRATFLLEDATRWNRIRHRMAPASADAIDALQVEGGLCVSAATVSGISPLGSGIRVDLSDGTSREVGWVINCTGPETDVRAQGNPLLDDLLRGRSGGAALANIAFAGLGLRTRLGRLVDAGGDTCAPIWTLGSLRRGELWESTALPEIRSQASSLAWEIVDLVGRVRTGSRTSAAHESTYRRRPARPRPAVPA